MKSGLVSRVYVVGGAALGLAGLLWGLLRGDWSFAAFCTLGLGVIALASLFGPRSPERSTAQYAAATALLLVAAGVVYLAT